jgi:hypothetical protein
MEIHVFTPRFFRLLGLIVMATLVAFMTVRTAVAHAAASRIHASNPTASTVEPPIAARGQAPGTR